jgi:hypothetical protein
VIVGAFFATRPSSEVEPVTDAAVESVKPAPGSEQPAPASKNDAVAVAPDSVKPDPVKPKQSERPAKPAAKEDSLRKANLEQDAKRDSSNLADRVRATPAPSSPVERLIRVLRRNSVVVLFFRQRGADDDATAKAVASVRAPRVAVLTLPIGNAPKYSAALDGITVSRAPSVVVVSRKREPLLIEGFIDSATLRQAVADSR